MKTLWNLDKKLPLNFVIRDGVLINNPPATQFSSKFELILCKYYRTSHKGIKTLDYLSSTQGFEVLFPEEVLNQRTHFAVLMLKSMKSQK